METGQYKCGRFVIGLPQAVDDTTADELAFDDTTAEELAFDDTANAVKKGFGEKGKTDQCTGDIADERVFSFLR